MEKTDIRYWMNLQVGDIIQLSDEQTIKFLMEQGSKNISYGADFEILRDRRITSQDKNIKWLLFDIQFEEVVWLLVVKIVGSSIDLYIYYKPDGIEDGNRNDLISSVGDWAFKPDETKSVEEWELASSILQDGNDATIEFKAISPIYGVCCEKDGNVRDFSTIVEYEADKVCDNPFLLTLELNGISGIEDSDEYQDEWGNTVVEISKSVEVNLKDSFITVFQGCKTRLSEVTALK